MRWWFRGCIWASVCVHLFWILCFSWFLWLFFEGKFWSSWKSWISQEIVFFVAFQYWWDSDSGNIIKFTAVINLLLIISLLSLYLTSLSLFLRIKWQGAIWPNQLAIPWQGLPWIRCSFPPRRQNVSQLHLTFQFANEHMVSVSFHWPQSKW